MPAQKNLFRFDNMSECQFILPNQIGFWAGSVQSQNAGAKRKSFPDYPNVI